VTTGEGLAPPCESKARSERAPEAGPRRQSCGNGGGLSPRKREGSTCRWKAPRVGEAARVDAGAVEAIMALCGSLATGGSGARQEASEAGSSASVAADNAAPGKRRSRAVARHLVKNDEGRRRLCPKLETRRQAQLHLGSDCRKVVRRRPPDGIGVNASAHRGDGHRGCKPRGLGVERMSGARVECRLQRSVRSIFPA
jgi:hypothetical protein